MGTLLMVVGMGCGGLGALIALSGGALPGLMLALIGTVCFVGGAVISEIRQLKAAAPPPQ